MTVVVASVRHTGTRFVTNHLLADRRRTEFVPGPGEYYFNHADPQQLHTIRERAKLFPCIVPMRDPRAVAISWKKQRRDLADMVSNFHNLICGIDSLDPYYLPLDAPDRDEWLAHINANTDLDLKTDWPVICASSQPGRLGGTDPELLAGFLEANAKFFARFGYDVAP